MTTKIVRTHDERFGTYYVPVEVDPKQRKLKHIAWSLLSAAALGLGLIASGIV